MEGYNNGTPHFTLSKDINVGGIRLVSSVSPYSLDKHQLLSSTHPPLPVVEVDNDDKKEVTVVVDQEGAGGGHDVKHISTTEAEIERARTDLQNRHINVKSIRQAQSLLRGQGGKKQKSKAKSKQSKAKSKQSKAKSKQKPKKKKTSTKKGQGKKGKKSKKVASKKNKTKKKKSGKK